MHSNYNARGIYVASFKIRIRINLISLGYSRPLPKELLKIRNECSKLWSELQILVRIQAKKRGSIRSINGLANVEMSRGSMPDRQYSVVGCAMLFPPSFEEL